MNPLSALSALTQVQPQLTTTPGVNFQPTAPMPGLSGTTPIGEGFQNLVKPASELTIPDISIPSIPSTGAGSPSSWGHMVQQMVMDVNAKQTTAAQKVSDVLQGGPTPVHDAMVATEEASLSFEFVAEMRNKVVDAYNQVMQMQV